ncbi:MAG: pilus assembly protein [Actinomycetota bacterium]|nr:pilus assembly protein [Actinomycetota bacterium]
MRAEAVHAGRDDAGSAVVEFVLVSVLLTALFLAVVQLALTLHVRSTLQACAAEGARYGANLGLGPAEARARTAQLVADALSPRYLSAPHGEVTAGVEPLDSSGVPVVVVRVRARLPVVAALVPVLPVQVEGRALQELP